MYKWYRPSLHENDLIVKETQGMWTEAREAEETMAESGESTVVPKATEMVTVSESESPHLRSVGSRTSTGARHWPLLASVPVQNRRCYHGFSVSPAQTQVVCGRRHREGSLVRAVDAGHCSLLQVPSRMSSAWRQGEGPRTRGKQRAPKSAESTWKPCSGMGTVGDTEEGLSGRGGAVGRKASPGWRSVSAGVKVREAEKPCQGHPVLSHLFLIWPSTFTRKTEKIISSPLLLMLKCGQ